MFLFQPFKDIRSHQTVGNDTSNKCHMWQNAREHFPWHAQATGASSSLLWNFFVEVCNIRRHFDWFTLLFRFNLNDLIINMWLTWWVMQFELDQFKINTFQIYTLLFKLSTVQYYRRDFGIDFGLKHQTHTHTQFNANHTSIYFYLFSFALIPFGNENKLFVFSNTKSSTWWITFRRFALTAFDVIIWCKLIR